MSAAACLHYCTDPDVTWGNGRGCPLVVHYWADLQSVHGLRFYGNITRTRHVSECSVLALCLVAIVAFKTLQRWRRRRDLKGKRTRRPGFNVDLCRAGLWRIGIVGKCLGPTMYTQFLKMSLLCLAITLTYVNRF